MKHAIIQCADTGPIESLVVMLRAVGYTCSIPNAALRDALRPLGGLVLSNRQLVDSMGYEPHMPLGEVGPEAMQTCDLFVDIKAHQTYAALVNKWPRLEKRVLWYRINGGKPEHVIRYKDCAECPRYIGRICPHCKGKNRIVDEDCGDEVNPPCPVLTPNQWYRVCLLCTNHGTADGLRQCPRCAGEGRDPRSYTCWPPFVSFRKYPERTRGAYANPICLIHNINGWGYQALVDSVRALKVRCYGRGSPDGLIPHSQVPDYLHFAKAYIHLKSNDAPGYALYEALAAKCPIICSRRLIWRCKMQDLLIPNETCLVFDRETHDGLTPQDVRECTADIDYHLSILSDPVENRRIGEAGHNKLKELMWSENNPNDVKSLAEFMKRNFA